MQIAGVVFRLRGLKGFQRKYWPLKVGFRHTLVGVPTLPSPALPLAFGYCKIFFFSALYNASAIIGLS